MSGWDFDVLTKKRLGNNRYSITDVLSFIFIVLFAVAANNAFNGINPLAWFNVNINLDNVGWIAMVLLVVNGLSALNIGEDSINTLFRTVMVPVMLIWAVGGDFDNAKVQANSYITGHNISGNYLQTPQGLNNPTIVNTPPQNVGDANLRKWNNIGAAQELQKLSPLSEDGLKWCNTNLNNNNQSRLHCYTKYKWTKSGWSKLNTTK